MLTLKHAEIAVIDLRDCRYAMPCPGAISMPWAGNLFIWETV